MNFSRLCALLLVFALSSRASDSGTLKGTVKDPSGAVVSSGVLVVIEHWALDPQTRKKTVDEKTVYTDEKGQYSLELPPGFYDVFFSGMLWAPVAKKVEVKTGKVTLLSPKMSLDPLILSLPPVE